MIKRRLAEESASDSNGNNATPIRDEDYHATAYMLRNMVLTDDENKHVDDVLMQEKVNNAKEDATRWASLLIRAVERDGKRYFSGDPDMLTMPDFEKIVVQALTDLLVSLRNDYGHVDVPANTKVADEFHKSTLTWAKSPEIGYTCCDWGIAMRTPTLLRAGYLSTWVRGTDLNATRRPCQNPKKFLTVMPSGSAFAYAGRVPLETGFQGEWMYQTMLSTFPTPTLVSTMQDSTNAADLNMHAMNIACGNVVLAEQTRMESMGSRLVAPPDEVIQKMAIPVVDYVR